MRALGYGSALLFGASLLCGCRLNRVSGMPQVALVSVAKEQKIGLEQSKKVEEGMGLVDDPQLVSYVEEIGRRLVAQVPNSEFNYTFRIVDMPEPNAFALPGGYVFVSRGLLTLTNSEDELAAVMGHEIGHVVARHATARSGLAAPFLIATGITALATSIVSPALGQVMAGLGGLTGSLVLAPYSREQERESDRYGIQLAAAAGWDPNAMSRFLETLENDDKLHGGKSRRPSFLASHPSTPQRVSATAEYAESVTRSAPNLIAGDQRSFFRRLDGLIVGDDPAAGVISGNRFLHPALNFALGFPEAWKIENTAREVAAVSPNQDAAVVVAAVRRGDDPAAVARAAAEEVGLKPQQAVIATQVNALPAARLQTIVQSEGDRLALDVTWIAYQGLIYQVTGITAPANAARYNDAFAQTWHSFGPLSAEEKRAIQETRLRIVAARAGDSLDKLAERSKSVWKSDELAIKNGLAATAVLQADQPLKVAQRQPYTERARPAPPSS